jgi:eukaryotic-like serine/threonine-protein kinase
MSPELWQQIQEVFDKARACEPAKRAALLQEACEDDEELRREIEWMLAHQEDAKHFIDAPALKLAAISIAADPGASLAGSTLAGSTLGSYVDLRLIGRGGMGEVYRARDPKLMRDVAIKVLPKAFASDSSRLARFQREAQVLASLNHPNISTIYDIQEERGIHFIVLEYVEGVTLSSRLKRGPLPIDETLSLLKQVAEALEAAHEKGILHRDLKPSNIQITPEGRVKVLDFGLAKMIDAERKLDAVHSSGNGIFGTASYMSPEQASGGLVDRRTDIWAFGCVLYEMLTERRAFEGENAAVIIAAVMKSEPDYDSLPATTPAAVRTLLCRCLQKQPKHRLHDISDVRIAIEDALMGLRAASPSANPPASTLMLFQRNRAHLASALLGLASLLVLALAVPRILYNGQKKQDQAVHFLVDPPPMPNPFQVTVSPDGRKLAFVAGTTYTIQPPDQTTSASVLYVRPMDSTNAQPLSGTEAALESILVTG